MAKPKILFFSRSFYADFFPELVSENYESIHATLTSKEKNIVLQKGGKVCGCFELEYDNIKEIELPDNYLITSFYSDRFLINRKINERKTILSKEISFWRNILDKEKPDFVINETVAIEISEVLYLECLKKNIPYFSFLVGILRNTTIWKPNPLSGSLFETVDLNYPFKDETILRAKEYLLSKRSKFEKPFYIQNHIGENRFNFRRAISELISDIKRIKYKLIRKWFKSQEFKYEDVNRNLFFYIKRYLNSLFFRYDDINKLKNINYVFHPLHVEPESTLLYFSEFFDNQENNINKLVRTLGNHQFLVVKEHPQQFGMLLSKNMRKLKKRNPNLLFYPSEIPSENIIQNAEAVVTLTSSAAWEAILQGKPVIILGDMYWDNYPNLIKTNSFSSIRDIIRNKKYIYPNEETTIKYISYLIEKHTKEGMPYPHPLAFSEQNYSKVIKVIEEKILEYKE